MRVSRGGEVGNHKGVHLPDSDIKYELPTREDKEWIDFLNPASLEVKEGCKLEPSVRELSPGDRVQFERVAPAP